MTEQPAENSEVDPQPAEPRTTSEARKARKEADEQARFAIYDSVPQKHYRMLSGRDAKILKDQAVRYGIPCGGAVVQLSAVLRGFHDFLAKYAKEQQKAPPSESLEQYRVEKIQLARLKRLEIEGTLVPRDLAHAAFGAAASVLREAGEQLQRQFGVEAGRILEGALEDAALAVDMALKQSVNDLSSPSRNDADSPLAGNAMVPGAVESGKATKPKGVRRKRNHSA